MEKKNIDPNLFYIERIPEDNNMAKKKPVETTDEKKIPIDFGKKDKLTRNNNIFRLTSSNEKKLTIQMKKKISKSTNISRKTSMARNIVFKFINIDKEISIQLSEIFTIKKIIPEAIKSLNSKIIKRIVSVTKSIISISQKHNWNRLKKTKQLNRNKFDLL